MIKAIVASKAELEALKDGEGYVPTFEEGDVVVVAGVQLILIAGKWVDKIQYDAEQSELAEKKLKSLESGE